MNRKNITEPLFGFLTLIFCFISISCFFLKVWIVFWICLTFFFATLIIFSVLSYKEIVNFFVSRQLRYGTNVALSIIGVLGIAVFINIIVAQRFDKSIDLTELGHNSLSKPTKKILKSLDKDIDVIAFYSDETSQFAIHAMNKLELFQRESKFISVSFKNPYLDADLVDHRLRDGTIVFRTNDRQEEVTIVSEQKFTSAILKLIQNKPKKIYFLVGNGEHEIDNLTGAGLSKLKTALENHNYEPIPLPLLTEPNIPTDCDLLAIVGPTLTLSAREIGIISKYLDKNGKLLLLFHPSDTTEDVNQRLVQLMKRWGVSVGNDLVVDKYNFNYSIGSSAPLLQYELHEITRQLPSYIVFPKTRSVTPLEKAKSDLTVKSLAKTTGSIGVSWGERERTSDGKFSGTEYTQGIDLPGPVSLAVAVEKNINVNTDNISPTRIIVLGCSNFAMNHYFDVANRYFLLTTVNWLTEEGDLIAITEPDLSEQMLRTMTLQQSGVVQITAIFMIPLVVFIAGLVVWWNRRTGGTV